MIFLTVGTQFGFDRLVKAIDCIKEEGLIPEDIFAQIGDGKYKPKNFSHATSLEKHEFDSCCRKADGMIGHAGMGTIAAALEFERPLLVLPRRARYGEVVNDHQVGLALHFEQLGHLLAAGDESELGLKVRQLSRFKPKQRETQIDAIATRIRQFLELM